MKFTVELESGTPALGHADPPCEGAKQGALASDPSVMGWFVDFEAVPTEINGFPVRFTEVDIEGLDGHLTILDQTSQQEPE